MNMTEWRKARKMIADMRKLAEQLHGEGHDASAAMVRRAMELIDDAFPCFAGNGERLPLKVSA